MTNFLWYRKLIQLFTFISVGFCKFVCGSQYTYLILVDTDSNYVLYYTLAFFADFWCQQLSTSQLLNLEIFTFVVQFICQEFLNSDKQLSVNILFSMTENG